MALTRVTLPGMIQAIGEMGQMVSTTSSTVNTTSSTVSGLSSTWTGQSASTFQQARVAWEQNCNQILRAMQELEQAMTASANTYKQTEQLNADESAQLNQALSAMQL